MLPRLSTRFSPMFRRALPSMGGLARVNNAATNVTSRHFSGGVLQEKLIKIGAQTLKQDIISMSPSFAVIDKLHKYVDENPELGDKLVQSLCIAKSKADNGGLDPNLFAVLDWPTSFEAYEKFLFEYSRWIPQQSSLPAWQTPEGTSQEIFDRLSHFYFLIDQPLDDGKVVQNDEFFSEWLVEFAQAWGTFLNTPESFSDEILQTYIENSPQFRIDDSMIEENGVWRPNNPSGWLSFNQFFARTINPGLRPIDSPLDNTIMSSPADFNFRQIYEITSDSTIVENPRFKKTHTIGSIEELLDGSPYGNAFANGTFIHYYLSTFSYHRFHAPVNGRLVDCKAVQGKTYLDVNLLDGQFDMPDGAETGYEFSQARGVATFDTSGSPYGDVGVVAVVPIGMCQVSSVNMTGKPGLMQKKGEEFGYFMFGGSDCILLFQEGVTNADMLDLTGNYHFHGSKIGNLNCIR